MKPLQTLAQREALRRHGRREFSKQTKRAALQRSGQKCEAVGAMYGLAADQRCNASLSYGVQFDHIVLDANSKDNSLENCAAVCVGCHRWKSAKHDTPMAAKTVRLRDKNDGIKGSARPMDGSRNSPWKKPFNKPAVLR